MTNVLTYSGDKFYLNGKPFIVLSGVMHYYRIPHQYWYDRLLKLRECGFNTVETYIPWNIHEPKEGAFTVSEEYDFVEYTKIAQALGLYVILRPGPYVCTEWDMGGLPSWLLTYKDMEFRCCDAVFLEKVEAYFDKLLPVIKPRLASRGGNVFMLQIENEYGSFGDDKEYLRAIYAMYKKHDMECLYFTSDGAEYTMLSGGTIDECLAVANFGSKTTENLNFLKAFRPNQPLMCGEFWSGWFDHWFEKHQSRPSDEIMENLQEFLDLGASINFYAFHGGTNFAFMNGANYGAYYNPVTTSYDFGAPLNESGDRTELYYRIRDFIKKNYGEVPALTAKDSEKKAYGKIRLTKCAPLFDNLCGLSSPVHTAAPKFMEDIGQDYGYTLYRTVLEGPKSPWKLGIDTVHDRAEIFVDGKKCGVFERWDKECQDKANLTLPLGHGERACLDILVENMGRVNYGPKLRDNKGIRGVRFLNSYHFGWEMYPLDMRDLSGLEYTENEEETHSAPVFLKGELIVEGAPCDTFLKLDGFTKGFVCVNGKNIGRYFNPAGPQKTLYVPAPYLKRGVNEIIVFESDETSSAYVEFCDSHLFCP